MFEIPKCKNNEHNENLQTKNGLCKKIIRVQLYLYTKDMPKSIIDNICCFIFTDYESKIKKNKSKVLDAIRSMKNNENVICHDIYRNKEEWFKYIVFNNRYETSLYGHNCCLCGNYKFANPLSYPLRPPFCLKGGCSIFEGQLPHPIHAM